jgi:sugar phosphate isomerase/epimerase
MIRCRHLHDLSENPMSTRPRPTIAGRRILPGALLVVLLAASGGASPGVPHDTDPVARETPTEAAVPVKGMTISCPGAGQIWGSDAMVETMRTLKDLGLNWVAIHPYAGIRSTGQVPLRDEWYGDSTEWLTRPIEEAHKLGLKIMIKPHIAYWGSPFSWRGEIDFTTDEQWGVFFNSYTAWIKRVAELSKDADAFVVGTELDRTVRFEDEWRGIIRDVRAITDAPLTYSANWDSYRRVGFWDALDVIGVQSYFPLVRHDNVPTEAELTKGWTRVLGELERYSKRHNLKVVFAELGYNRSARAALEPWDYRTGGTDAEEVQRRCLDCALQAIEGNETVVGAFLWKWFPGERARGNFIKSTPVMREVIGSRWGE